MANRNIIFLHLLESDTYEFYGSPASLYDRHEAKELLIAQTSLNNHFSKMAAQDKELVYRNDYCENRKGCIYVLQIAKIQGWNYEIRKLWLKE